MLDAEIAAEPISRSECPEGGDGRFRAGDAAGVALSLMTLRRISISLELITGASSVLVRADLSGLFLAAQLAL